MSTWKRTKLWVDPFDFDAARIWFKRAMVIGGREEIKRMALADSDLEPLWKEISQW